MHFECYQRGGAGHCGIVEQGVLSRYIRVYIPNTRVFGSAPQRNDMYRWNVEGEAGRQWRGRLQGESTWENGVELGAEETWRVHKVERNLALAAAESEGEPGRINKAAIPWGGFGTVLLFEYLLCARYSSRHFYIRFSSVSPLSLNEVTFFFLIPVLEMRKEAQRWNTLPKSV